MDIRLDLVLIGKLKKVEGVRQRQQECKKCEKDAIFSPNGH